MTAVVKARTKSVAVVRCACGFASTDTSLSKCPSSHCSKPLSRGRVQAATPAHHCAAAYDRRGLGASLTLWSYKPREGQRIADGHAGLSGISPATAGEFGYDMAAYGHVILSGTGGPWHHKVAGCGVGHDDAIFAESGTSMAAYYESGDAYGGRWWENESDRRKYGFTDLTACFGCDARGVIAPDGYTGPRYCETCLANV